MTDADLKLCRDIAKLEYPDREVFEEGVIGPWWYVDGYCRPLSRYLTNPAETVRMLKALIEAGWARDGIDCSPDELEQLLAEAYRAMLKEKTK